MFLKSSRYFSQKQVDVLTGNGEFVRAVSWRRLPKLNGEPIIIEENDRLDIIAERRYQTPSKFWHIADANTELEANDLVQKVGRTIQVPK